MRKVLFLVPLVLAAVPAQAADTSRDPYASAAILSGDFAKAERTLIARLDASPALPEAMLNLGVVYMKTGRAEEARQLFTRVLTQEDVLMDLPSEKVVSSHALATAGLKRLGGVQTYTAAR